MKDAHSLPEENNVAEASVEVEFNMVRFFRLALFGSYRYTSDITMPGIPANALRGWSGV